MTSYDLDGEMTGILSIFIPCLFLDSLCRYALSVFVMG